MTNVICPSLSRGGFVLGMQTMPVNPPATAAAHPDAIVSSSSSPGSRKCTCRSINPGTTRQPAASMVRSALGRCAPNAVILPFSTNRSTRRSKTCRGSRTVPFLISNEAMSAIPYHAQSAHWTLVDTDYTSSARLCHRGRICQRLSPTCTCDSSRPLGLRWLKQFRCFASSEMSKEIV